MKITLITACYNSAGTIRTAMESVFAQRGVDVEYIVVDGGSTDGTVEIVEEFSHREHKGHKEVFEFKWISEKDEGMYDAINKGIKMATGDVVGILNADDMLEGEDTLAHVVEGFNAEVQSRIPPPKSRPLTEVVETVAKHQAAGFSPSTTKCSLTDSGAECKGGTKNISGGEDRVEAVYADVRFVKDDLNTTVRYYSAKRWKPWMLQWGKMPLHPSVYIRREVFERLGGYKLGYQISADFELMVRFLCRNRIRTAYLPESVVKMRMGGKSTKNWKANVLLNVENVRANRENGYFSCFAMMLPKYLFKIWGFVFKRK